MRTVTYCVYIATFAIVLFSSQAAQGQTSSPSIQEGRSVAKALLGKTRAEVEKKIGKPVKFIQVDFGKYIYNVNGFKSVEVVYAPPDYSKLQGFGEDVDNRVLSLGVAFLRPLKGSPQLWKEGLKMVGVSQEGVIIGKQESRGYFKGMKGMPAGFIGSVEIDRIYFTHWSFLPTEMFPWSHPE